MLKKSQKYNLAIATTATVLGSTFIGITSAEAATFTYDLTRPGTLNSSTVILSDTFPLPSNTSTTAYLTAPVGAPTLTLTAIKPDGNSANVSLRERGVGVAGAPRAAHIGADDDGSEELFFSFSQNVILKSATFSRVGGDTLGVNDGFGLKDQNGNVLLSLDTLNQVNLYQFSTSFIGSAFSFFAPDTNDRYVLKNITIETVPEFSSIWGLLGLGVLGLARKKPITSKN